MQATQVTPRVPWNKGKLVGQKAPFKPREIWTLRARLQMQQRTRELALLDLGIDSKLRACDLVALRVRDLYHGDHIARRATVVQRKTLRPVQFEVTPATQEAVEAWVKQEGLTPDSYLFPSRIRRVSHIAARQYARILHGWVQELGLDPTRYGTHSMRRTKASLIYKKTKNLRAVQLLLGHSQLESTARYLGVELDDALEIAEQTEI
jgi:integrase